MSFSPIIVPIFLMLLKTVGNLESKPFGTGTLYNVIDSLGQTIIALFIQKTKMFGLLMEYLENL